MPDGSFACISGKPRHIARMSVPQTTIGIAYDYDQTLSPTYMQDEVLFPAFGINSGAFWKKCQQLVREEGWESELAYLKTMLDYLDIDRPTNEDLEKLGNNLKFYKGLPEMFDELNTILPGMRSKGVYVLRKFRKIVIKQLCICFPVSIRCFLQELGFVT